MLASLDRWQFWMNMTKYDHLLGQELKPWGSWNYSYARTNLVYYCYILRRFAFISSIEKNNFKKYCILTRPWTHQPLHQGFMKFDRDYLAYNYVFSMVNFNCIDFNKDNPHRYEGHEIMHKNELDYTFVFPLKIDSKSS